MMYTIRHGWVPLRSGIGQDTYTCVSLWSSCTVFCAGQWVLTLCGWEGNHRSGVALAMRHRFNGISTYGFMA